MAVVHQPMAPVARQGGVGIRRPGQQRVRIDAGAMGLVAQLDATEVALVAPPRSASGHKPLFMDIAAGTAEPIRPTSLLQGSLTLLLGAVEPLEAWQREAFLELDAAARHNRTGIRVPAYDPKAAAAERAG